MRANAAMHIPASVKGFTFVELLATMALLAIVLPVVMGGISLSLSTAGFARQEAQAASLAHSKLMELVAGAQWQRTNLDGDFGAEQPDYRWTARVSDWDGTVIRQLDVTVSWRATATDRSVTMSTLAYTGGEE